MDSLFFYIAKLAWVLVALDSLLIIWLGLGVLCLIMARHSLAKWLLSSLLLVCLTIGLFPVGEWLLYSLERQYAPISVDANDIDGVIVLGGAEKNAYTHAWQQVSLGSSGERPLALLQMVKLLPVDTPILYTGGTGKMTDQGISGAEVIRRLLADHEVDIKRVMFEDLSRNTVENAVFSKRLVNPQTEDNWLLVTSAFHMPRSVAIFCKQDWQVTPYPVDFRSRKDKLWRMDWDFAKHLKNLNTAYREWLGIWAYKLADKSC